MGGNAGDSTQQGTCPETNQVCAADGSCPGTKSLYFRILRKTCILIYYFDVVFIVYHLSVLTCLRYFFQIRM